MIALEIILVAVGLLAVLASYRVSEKAPEENQTHQSHAASQLQDSSEIYEEQLEELKKRLDAYQLESLEKTSEALSKLSNDKLLGMNEYSNQVLERMSKNHEEVVFLYNMLNEKEDELKDLMHHADSVKAGVREETSREYQSLRGLLSKLQETQKAMSLEQAEMPFEKGATEDRQPERFRNAFDTAPEQSTVLEHQKPAKTSGESGNDKSSSSRRQGHSEKRKKTVSGEQQRNHNQEIVSLYKEGHSVLEISKLLSIGQGEVKFVIDLFENQRDGAV